MTGSQSLFKRKCSGAETERCKKAKAKSSMGMRNESIAKRMMRFKINLRAGFALLWLFAMPAVVGCGPLNSSDLDPGKIFQAYEVTFYQPDHALPYTTALANFRKGGNVRLTGASRVLFNDQPERNIDLLQNYRWRTEGLRDVRVVYINTNSVASTYLFNIQDAPARIDLKGYGFNGSLSLHQLNQFKLASKGTTTTPKRRKDEKEAITIQVTQGKRKASFSFELPLPNEFALDLGEKSQPLALDTGQAVLTIHETRTSSIFHPEDRRVIGRKSIGRSWSQSIRLTK